MPRVISVHEYILKPDADEKHFEQSVQRARDDEVLHLPGLVDYYLVKGIKGPRRGCYATIWVYESREAWERLWGHPDSPRPRQDYPDNWKTWEEQVLAPFLAQDPDTIRFTSYQEI